MAGNGGEGGSSRDACVGIDLVGAPAGASRAETVKGGVGTSLREVALAPVPTDTVPPTFNRFAGGTVAPATAVPIFATEALGLFTAGTEQTSNNVLSSPDAAEPKLALS